MTAIDPVCKMMVEETDAEFTSVHRGKTYYFCASVCKTKFDSNPRKYTK